MRIATDRIASTAIAVMPGAVLARLRSAKHRAGWSGSWSAWRRERSIRCFLAWVTLVMEEEISGWLIRYSLVFPVVSIPYAVVCLLVVMVV